MVSKGWGIVQLAESCDIPYRTAQNYLGDERKIGLDALVKMCTRLGINVNWLLTGEGEMYQDQIRFRDNKLCTIFEQLTVEQQQMVFSITQEMVKMNSIQQEVKQLSDEISNIKGSPVPKK